MKTQKLVKLTTLIVFLALIFSCRKDNIVIEPEEIEEVKVDSCDGCPRLFPIIGPSFGYQYVNDCTFFENVQFNPNNDNEILYTQFGAPGKKQIVKYNLISKEKTLLAESVMFGAPSWGKQGYIVFTGPTNSVFRLRDDGSELIKLTEGGAFFDPEWNEEGTQFVAYHAFIYTPESWKQKIFDLEGNVIDSIKKHSGSIMDWQKNDLIAFVSTEELYTANLQTKEVKKHLTAQVNHALMNDFVWLSENEALYSDYDKGIFNLKFPSLEKTNIVCSCSSRKYIRGSVNSNSTKVAYIEIQLTHITDIELLQDYKIVTFNIDGTGREEIIP